MNSGSSSHFGASIYSVVCGVFLLSFFFLLFFSPSRQVIINKYGSMMFSQDFTRSSKVSSNDSLRMASTFHGLHAISCEISPVPGSSGILEIETPSFRLKCLQTPTGLKLSFFFFFFFSFSNSLLVRFYVVAHPHNVDGRALDTLLGEIYALFCDFVLKNPFYEPDQPVRAAKFETALDKLIRNH